MKLNIHLMFVVAENKRCLLTDNQQLTTDFRKLLIREGVLITRSLCFPAAAVE